VTGPGDVRRVVDAYVDAYRRNDKQACVDLFAASAVWHDPVGEPPHVGHDGISAFWDQARVLAETIELVPSDVIACGNQAAMVFEIHVMLAGPEGSAATTMIMDAVEVFVIDDDGKIAELRAYWDMSRARSRA
jgi:steroid Delta-isomerase